MNTDLRSALPAHLFRGALLCALLLAPVVSQEQTFFGSGGATNAATSASNVGLGFSALGSNTAGSNNTAIGYAALDQNTTGVSNTANGYSALYFNTTGNANTAEGVYALLSNTTGYWNTATGVNALYYNATGYWNVAAGVYSLFFNTTGYWNAATGVYSLYSNTTGAANTADGVEALFSNRTGNTNTAEGVYALYSNSLGYSNTANGVNTLYSNTTGNSNTALGVYALYSNVAGSSNIALGYGAGYYLTGSNNIAIGHPGVAGDSGVIRIGTAGTHTAAYLAGVNGVTINGGVAVYINSNGQLGTLTSSRRFKRDIQDMGNASDHLMQLRPVTFRYNDTAEKGPHTLQYGLIAEEVAKVYPNLVQYDKAGKPFTVYYHLLTPMLLNELQKAHQTEQVQKTQIAALKTTLQQQSAELASLKQAQAQQRTALTKLAALVEASQDQATPQQTLAMQH